MGLKLNKKNQYKGNFNKNILKGILSLGLVGTMLTSFAACGVPEQNEYVPTSYYTTLTENKVDFEPMDFSEISTEFELEDYEFVYQDGSEISDPVYFEFYDSKNGGFDDEHLKTNGYVVEKSIDGKKVLVDASNHENIVCSNYKVIHKPVVLNIDGKSINVIEIEDETGAKRLVYANDLNNVIIDSYKSISCPVLYMSFDPEAKPQVDNVLVREIITMDDEKILVRSNNFEKELLRGYDSISNGVYFRYYDKSHGGVDDDEDLYFRIFGIVTSKVDYCGYVRKIEMPDGSNKIVDATELNKVLFENFESISEAFYLNFYDSGFGGPDDGEFKDDSNTYKSDNGYVYEIINKDGVKYLVDANNFDKVIISGYDYFTDPFYLEYYDAKNGGTDENGKINNGFVWEFVFDSEKVLYDANDLGKELIRGYESIDSNESGIVVTNTDGTKNIIRAKDFPINNEIVTAEKEEETTESSKEEEILKETEEDTSLATEKLSLEQIIELRNYSKSFINEHKINDRECLECIVGNYESVTLIDADTYEEIIPSGIYSDFDFPEPYITNAVVGVSLGGDIDLISFDSENNPSITTLLEDVDCKRGFYIEFAEVPYFIGFDHVHYLVGSHTNLNTKVTEIEAGQYKSIDATLSSRYFIGVTPDGDVDLILRNQPEKRIYKLAKDTDFDTVAREYDYDDSDNKYIRIYNSEDGKENGKVYMISDDLSLVEAEKSKQKVK